MSPERFEPDAIYKPAEVARRLEVTTKTLAALPIRRTKLGHRTVRYRGKWVLDYLERRAA
jgi:hypothetical protein